MLYRALFVEHNDAETGPLCVLAYGYTWMMTSLNALKFYAYIMYFMRNMCCFSLNKYYV